MVLMTAHCNFWRFWVLQTLQIKKKRKEKVL
jgi:hypothetical protein